MNIDLISNTDFLECNETENIIDYLLKHRVLSESQYLEINEQKCLKSRNIKLLEVLQYNIKNEEFSEINICGLFANALRSSGCHNFASLLEGNEEPLVSPVARRRGQIELIIQVSALQIKLKSLLDKKNFNYESLKRSGDTNLIWLQGNLNTTDDGDMKMFTKKSSKKFSLLQLLCCHFRTKKSDNNNNNKNMDIELFNRHKHKQLQVNDQIEEIRQKKLDLLCEKSHLFYSQLIQDDCKEWENCVKYFEQTHKVLVFDRKIDNSALKITLICTKQDNLITLKTLLTQGTLEKEMSRLLLSNNIMDKISVKNLKLSVTVFQEELVKASEELSSKKHLHNQLRNPSNIPINQCA